MAGNKNDFVSDKRLYLDADDNVVDENNPKRAKLLVAEGASLPREEAEKYGLAKPLVEDETAELSEFAPGEEEGEEEGEVTTKAPASKKRASAKAKHK